MKEYRITLLNNNPPFSGVGRYAYELYRHLNELNLDVNFISWDKELFNSLYQRLEALRLNWLYYLLKFRYLSNKLRINGSLIHVTNAGYLIATLPLLKEKYNIPIIITAHDLVSIIEPRSIADFVVARKISSIKSVNRVICISESTKSDLLRFIDVDPKKVRVIYHGVDHELFKPRDKLEARLKLGLPLDRPLILNVGSEEHRKNIPTLLKSFKKLLNDVPNALLVRVGEKTANTEKLIEKLELNGRIVYLKPSDKELAYLYNASDTFVFPSYYEGLGFPILEAMASGLPIIAGNRASIPEVVDDAEVLLDPFDVDGFAHWMCEVLVDEDLRAKLSEAGYKRSLNFSWEKCARETLEVYKEVLDEA
jgi:glycosyltransferase involved in cell wall biosynthesis